MTTPTTPSPQTSQPSTLRYITGMIIASIFSFVYLITPLYLLLCIVALFFQYPNPTFAWIFASPLLLSILSKPLPAPHFVSTYLTPMLDYFEYEEIHEVSIEELKRLVNEEKKTFIFAAQPHGVVSFCGMCSAIRCPPDVRGIKTAAASVVLSTPIIKNVLGIFGLVDASGANLKKHFSQTGLEGCIVIYVGGIAELFKSSRKEERLYLKQRKGFIKYALRCGVDVVPLYLFGNTSVLTVVKNGVLATLSRRLQVSLTYFWGKFYLPIPRNDKLLYVRGKPLGLPHIAEPTEDDVNKWHAKYCEEVTRLFESYKEKVPMYKHKKLFID